MGWPAGKLLPSAAVLLVVNHPGGNPGENIKSDSHRCYLREVAFVWELTKETIHLPLRVSGNAKLLPSAACLPESVSVSVRVRLGVGVRVSESESEIESE